MNANADSHSNAVDRVRVGRSARPRIVVVGAGLAGSCAALALADEFDVTVVDAGPTVPGASDVGAGLVNPLLGRQGRRVWRSEEALAALRALIADADAEYTVSRRPVLRPAQDERQARKFRESAEENPRLGAWLEPDDCSRLYPFIHAPLGALQVDGGAIQIRRFNIQIQAKARERGVTFVRDRLVHGWDTKPDNTVSIHVGSNGHAQSFGADHVLLCTGAATPRLSGRADLNLHLLKGQTVIADLPTTLNGWPHLSGSGYVVVQHNHLVLGSTYERDFESTEPSDAATHEIIEKVSGMSPLFSELSVRDARAGVRVTVPGSYLPMLGPLPDADRVWLFTGLGSKGLLMAPLLAAELPAYLSGSVPIPDEIRPRPAGA